MRRGCGGGPRLVDCRYLKPMSIPARTSRKRGDEQGCGEHSQTESAFFRVFTFGPGGALNFSPLAFAVSS